MVISPSSDARASASPKAERPYFLVVNIGDSNAAGFSEAVQANLAEGAEPYGFQPGIFRWDGSKFGATNVATNISQTTGKSAAWTLARSLAAQGQRVGIVDVAVDGTKLADSSTGWNPDGADPGSAFSVGMAHIRSAIAAGGVLGCTYISCSANDPKSQSFSPTETLTAYEALIGELRDELGSGSSVTDGMGSLDGRPILIAGVADLLISNGLDITSGGAAGSAAAGDYAAIDTGLRQLAQRLDGVEYVSALGLSLEDQGFTGTQPRIHFTDQAQQALGRRAFGAYLRSAESDSPEPQRTPLSFARRPQTEDAAAGTNLWVWERFEPWSQAAYRYNLAKAAEMATIGGSPAFDERGYPISPGANEVQIRFFVQTTLHPLDGADFSSATPSPLYRPGRYFIFTRGSGSFTIALDSSTITSLGAQSDGTEKWEFSVATPTGNGCFINIGAGSNFTDIRIVHEADLHYTEENPWDLDLLRDLEGVKHLRFMQTQLINYDVGNNTPTGYASRPRWDAFSWSSGQFPFRAAISLCNALDCDVWWHMPDVALGEAADGELRYAQADALDFKTYANPGMVWISEGSNEVWGGTSGGQTGRLQAIGVDTYGVTDSALESAYAALNELCSVWWCAVEEVLGDQAFRHQREIGVQNANVGVTNVALDYVLQGTPGVTVNAREVGVAVYNLPVTPCVAPYSPTSPVDVTTTPIASLSIPATQSELDNVLADMKAQVDTTIGHYVAQLAVLDNYDQFNAALPSALGRALDTYEFGGQLTVSNADPANITRLRQWTASSQAQEWLEYFHQQFRAVARGRLTYYLAFARGTTSGAVTSFGLARWQGQSTVAVTNGTGPVDNHPLLGVFQADARKRQGTKKRGALALSGSSALPSGTLSGDLFPNDLQQTPTAFPTRKLLVGEHVLSLKDNANPADSRDWLIFPVDYDARTETLNTSATNFGLSVTSKGGVLRNRTGEHLLATDGSTVIPGLGGSQTILSQPPASEPNGATLSAYDWYGSNAAGYRDTAGEIGVQSAIADFPLFGGIRRLSGSNVPGLSSGQAVRAQLDFGLQPGGFGFTEYTPRFLLLLQAPGLDGLSPATSVANFRFPLIEVTHAKAEIAIGVNGVGPTLTRYGIKFDVGTSSDPAVNSEQIVGTAVASGQMMLGQDNQTSKVYVVAEAGEIRVYDDNPVTNGSATLLASILASGDVEVHDSAAGLILTGAANSTRARITLDDTDTGNLALAFTTL